MEFVYDNSESNIRNPNHPPRRVQTGERSVDEMGNITFSVGVASVADKAALREGKYRRQLRMSDSARGHYNLGNALADQGRRDEATAEYRRALALDGTLMPARLNLGTALLALGRAREAEAELAALVRAQPSLAPAHFNRGLALQRMGDVRAARREYEAALALDPQSQARAALATLPR
jgi:tetratricopeptide (TPR) repeat protein